MSPLPILMHHHVTPNPGLVTVSPTNFRSQMEWLARNGWHSVGAHEIEAFFQGHPLPKKSVAITFDDGYLDNFVHVHPVLEEFGLKAMLFIVTGRIGNGTPRNGAVDCPNHRECKKLIASGESDRVMLRWSEIERMQKAETFEFHSHTDTHTRWDQQIPQMEQRIAALAKDLDQTRETLSRRLGSVSRHLCWPQGYYDANYVETALRFGFDHLYTTINRTNLSSESPKHIGRIVVKDRSSGWLAVRMTIYNSQTLSQIYKKFRSLNHRDGDK